MALKVMKKYYMIMVLTAFCTLIYAQNSVPFGIYYQAVARNSSGTELANTKISVKFSIISGDPLGTLVYQELHQDIITSKFGVFSLVIGHGVPTSLSPVTSLSDISWKDANHYLKVEVKFENDFMDMGTIQFLAVPYALYAQKSLEPGPTGPKGDKGEKGDPGDPSTDNQTLSFNGNNLSISGGNTVNLSSLNPPHQLSLIGDTLSILGGNKIALTNQIQDLVLDVNNKLKITKNSSATEIDLNIYKQDLSYNPAAGILSISNGTGTDLSSLKTDAIQDIHLTGNLLTIDKNSSSTGVDLSPFKQNLSYDASSGILSISNGTGADLSSLKTDAIQDIHLTGNLLTIDKNSSSAGVDLSKYMDDTDKQQLTYNDSTKLLSIDRGNSVKLGTMVAFRARKIISVTASSLSDITFIPTSVEFNEGNAFNASTGEFIAPLTGIYTFEVTYYADGSGGSRKLSIYYNSVLYEDMAVEIASAAQVTVKSITMKLSANDVVKLVINTGTSTQTGTGTFSGFKVY
ncbi:MAG: hypothetical protein ABSA76_14740 [Bacteroidales bacterium]